ncbi:hypothetical protein LguiA_019571 [Lonicera macranthoides]
MSSAADHARTAVGIVGNVTSFLLFASPIPTIWRIVKNRSVEEFKPDPYIAAVMNCIMWVFYALPFVTPNSILVVTINSIGLALELTYLIVFLVFGDNKKKKKIVFMVLLELVVFVAIACATLILFHGHHRRSMFVGIFCVVFGIILYGSPLTIMRKVIKTKSVEYMPLWISLSAFANGVIWSAFALIRFDLFILIGNGVGGLLGLVQLILYACYYKTTPKKGDERAAEVQLPAATTRSPA